MFSIPIWSRPAALSFVLLLSVAPESRALTWGLTEQGAVEVYAPAEPAAAAAARRLAEGVEARRLLLEALLDRPLPATTPVVLLLLPDAASGSDFGVAAGRTRVMKRDHGVLGAALLPLAPAQERELLAGAVNALLGDHLGPLPVFWRDGFAEYLLDAEPGPQGVRPLATAERLEILEAKDWLSLSQFSELDIAKHRPETRARLASQVWALLYYDTMVAPRRKEKLQKFLRAALAGESASTAFMSAYGTYYDEVQIAVRDASRRSNGQAFAKFTASFPVALPPVHERPLASADAGAEQGLFLVELPAPVAAAARCAAARELEPEHPRALLCEARLLEQSGELLAARAGYEKAAAAAPGDGEIAYFAGMAWLRPAPDDPAADPAKALAHLRRARELSPALGNAWAGAAIAVYHAKPRPADAIVLAEEAHRLAPNRTDVGLALFRLYQEAGRGAEAETLARTDVTLRRQVVRSPGAPGGPAAPLDLAAFGPGAHDALTNATGLINQGEYEKALGMLLQLRQGADNPSVAGPLDAKIAELRQTIAHNLFVAGYNAAAEHFNHQRWDDTIAALEGLLPTAADEQQRKKADDLLGQARQMKAEYAKVAAHNDFIALLGKATALYNQRRFQEAAALVAGRLEEGLADPEDLRLAKAFLDQCQKAAAQRRGG